MGSEHVLGGWARGSQTHEHGVRNEHTGVITCIHQTWSFWREWEKLVFLREEALFLFLIVITS